MQGIRNRHLPALQRGEEWSVCRCGQDEGRLHQSEVSILVAIPQIQPVIRNRVDLHQRCQLQEPEGRSKHVISTFFLISSLFFNHDFIF